jgi:hypothetical protein
VALSWGEVVAVVAAGAWLPHLWKFFQRPKVTPIVGGQIEIGFSPLGPLFNPRVAFRVERRDALVTGVEYRVAHERGQMTTFQCVQLVEHGLQSESSSGERAFHNRQQDVVAVVLVPTVIAERKTNSREVRCLADLETFNIALARAVDRLRRPGSEWVGEVLRSPEYAEIKRFLETAFVWQTGAYNVECLVTVAGQRKPSVSKFRFVLGESSVALLRANIVSLETNFRESLTPSADAQPKKAADLNWVYPFALTPDARDSLPMSR